ncbi:hypothetical protein ABZX85_44595 [Streptomyces sp. NPDC004539]|uniref:hypothetical protein n=1 Tax=Streptomyces sp. NPDC004539 TaxID=3154280 RepID=UPI0033AC9861
MLQDRKKCMRKNFPLVAASLVVAFGMGVGMASSASASNLGFYQSQAACLGAKGARVNLYCDWSPGDDGRGVWVLTDRFGGG